MLRLPVHDASGAFRAYRVSKLRELELTDIRAGGYAYLEEILWHLARAGANFAEVPITFCERRAGRSKANLREVAGKISTVLRLASRR
jgi:dolichol-phosphate mannosyltransferase